MKTGIKIGNWGKVLFASLFAMVALGAQAIDKSLQAILDVRDPKGEPVRPGYWHADLAACRAKAEKEKIPMLAVWSKDGCFHCQIFEKAVNSDAFKEWQKTSGYIYCFICSEDADSKQGSANYTWCKGPGAKLKDWPLCRLYWPAGGVDYAVRGDVIDKQQGISNGTYDKAGRYVIDYLQNTSGFGRYVPKPSYLGGYFDCSDEPTLRLEAEPTTKTIYVPLKREATDATSQQITFTRSNPGALLQGASLAAVPAPMNVAWAANETEKVVELNNFDTTLYVENGIVTLTTVNAEGATMTTAKIYCLAASVPTVENPLWLGERTADTLEFGEWTMDLDVAKAKAAATDGDAFTLVAIEGSLWCPDCKGTSDNFLNVKNGELNRFSEWAKSKNVTFAMIDVPRFTNETVECGGKPTLLSRTAYTGLDNATMSGLSYLSRKGATDDEAAQVLERNRQLVQKNTSEGGLHRPEDPDPYRTGVPFFVLLRKDGTVAARLTRFSAVGRNLSASSWNNVIKRFDEMLEIAKAAPDGAHYDDIENNDASTTALSFKANGGSTTGEISNTDPMDVFKLEGVGGNALQKITVTGESAATVSVQFMKLAGGKAEAVGAAVSGKLSSGVSVEQTFTEAGDFFVKVSGDIAGADFGVENAKEGNFVPFSVSGAVVLVPQQAKATGTAADTSDTVTMRLVKDGDYRLQGVDTTRIAGLLNPYSDEANCKFFTALVSGDVEIPLFYGQGGDITYQLWVPCTVGFASSSSTVGEDAGDVSVALVRRDGKSGEVKVRVSLDEEKTTFYNSDDGNPRFEFEPVEITWKDGEDHETNVVVKVKKEGNRYDGDGDVALKLELVSDENQDTKLATTSYTLSVLEKDEAAPGEAAFARADPFFSKVQTLFVREGEAAKIYVSRLNASDGAVTVKVNAAGGQVEIDGAATDLIEWANHDSADREVTVKGLAAGKSATLTLASPTGGLTLSKTQAKATVTAVAVDGPVFQTPEASETLTQYVSTSNLYKLVSAPAGKVTFTAVSGKLPAGLKATYNAAENAMAVWGVPTKPGAYEVVFQAKDGSKAGLTQKIAFTVINPLTGDEAEGVPGNGSIAKSRTLKDLMVIDKSAKRLRGVVQITIPTKGNLSAKYQSAAGAVSLSTRSWSAFDVGSGALEATLTAKGGYEMNVYVTADGAVAAEISKDGALVGAVESNGQLWSASNTATAWQGYYTALLRNRHDVVEGTAGIAPTGTPYLTFDMSSAGASKTGTMKWAGVLPNGTAVSGSVLLTADGEFAYAPFFKQSKTDVFSGVAKIQKNAFGKIRACVFAHDDVEPAWEHIEKNEAASFAAAYDLAGAYYDKTYDNLLVCCLETYQGAQTHQGETFELDFSVDGAAVKTMVVQPATIKLKAGDNPSRLTFTFNDKTGLISGSVVSAAAGKACQYKGVVVLGLGGIDCGCGEVPEEGLLPFAAGSYYYSDKLQVGTTSLSIKRGGGIDIDAQQ